MSELDDDTILSAYDFGTQYVRFTYNHLQMAVLRFVPQGVGAWVLCALSDAEIRKYVLDIMALIRAADVPELQCFKIRRHRGLAVAMRTGDTYYTGTYVLRKCTNCGESWYTHVNEKCLYEPTNFAHGVDVRHKFLEDALKDIR